MDEIIKAKALIIDLRYNTGGNTGIGKEIFKHLTNDSILFGSKSVSRNHIPTYKAWGKFQKVKDATKSEWSRKALLSYQDKFYYEFPYQADTISNDDLRSLKNSRLVVPTVILIGHNTASAAEDFLIYADNQKHITKIGEPTFGSTGQPFMFDLPNGGSARVCTKKDTYPNGKEFVGVGIQPDILVKKDLKDFIENKDPVLEKAIEYLSQKK
jgi:C-terminal processing protease CtpA/Prc